jgi:hypothetical protein
MKNKVQRIRVFFTMNQDINSVFEKHIKDNLLNKSKVLENLIIEYLKRES